MLETVQFALADCPNCQTQVALHYVLGDDDDIVPACLHCDTVLSDPHTKMVGASGMQRIGYEVDGEIEKRGCGSSGGGGCSCSTKR